VKKDDPVKIEGPLKADALRILQGVPGFTAVRSGSLTQPDVTLTVADRETRLLVEFKSRANAATAWQMVHIARSHPGIPLLLVANESTAEAREILREHGVALVDGMGNADISLPGLLVAIDGTRTPTRTPTEHPPTRLRGKAGVAAQALLLEPEREWGVQELAERSRISTALAHRVLTRLEREGVMEVGGAGPSRVRRVTDRAALLDLWAEEAVERSARTTVFVLAPNPRQLITTIAQRLDQSSTPYAVTGGAAALFMAPFVTAVPAATIWLTSAEPPRVVVETLHARRVDEGYNVILLQEKNDSPLAFSEQRGEIRFANRFRVYADLLRESQRGREQAEHLRAEVIGF